MHSLPNNRSSIITGVVICNLFVWILAGYFLHQDRQQAEHQAEILSQNIAKAIDQSVSNSIEKVDLALRAVVDHLEQGPAEDVPKAVTTDSLLAAYEKRIPDIESMRVTDATGVVIFGNRPDTPVSYAGREFFLLLRGHPDAGLQISPPLLGRISHKWVIAFVRRYNQADGQFGGVVTATIPLLHFTDLLSGFEIGPKGGITLRNVNFAQIARYPGNLSGQVNEIGNTVVSSELRELVRSGVSHATYHTLTPIDNTRRILTFHRLSIAPIIATVGLASEDYLEQWRFDALVTCLLVVSILVISLASLVVMLRNLNEIRQKGAKLLDNNEILQRLIVEHEHTEVVLKSYAQRLIVLEEDLRNRISMELHDDIGQELTALGLNLAYIASNLREEAKDEIRATIEDSQLLAKEITRSVRNLMVDLRPSQLENYGLTGAIGSYADQYAQRTGLNIVLKIPPRFPRLSSDKEIALFRIFQEALNNVAKYASAKVVTIILSNSGAKVRLSVSDDGLGFLPRKTRLQPAGSGWGLTIMRERAELIGGSFEIDTVLGGGTSIVVEVSEEG